MWTHLFTLQALARELDTSLRKATLLEILSQHKNELLISIRQTRGTEQSLIISIDPKMNFLFLRDRIPRAKKNAVDLFSEIVNVRVASVSAHTSERRIVFRLEDGRTLTAQLFGTAESNVFLVDAEGLIQKAFKNNRKFEGTELPLEKHLDSLRNFDLFSSEIARNSSASIFEGLKETLPILGSTYAREVLHRTGVDENIEIARLDNESIRNIYDEVHRILHETEAPHPTVYFRDAEPRVFSIVTLRHLAGAHTEHFPSVNEAIRSMAFRTARTNTMETAKKELIHKLKAEYDRSRRAFAIVQKELHDTRRGEQYERIANVLMANLQHLTKGTKVVELEDIFARGKEQLRISLDPKLTPAQNVEQYFMKAKKARAARGDIEQRASALEQKISQLEKLLLHVDYCQTTEQLDEFQQEHRAQLQQWNIFPGKKQAEQPPFRVFTVDGALQVWVGKSSANNDLLTMKFARPNDLWFHVRGASGSHAVLKVTGGKGKPSKAAIQQAARIAAYYSKMRNASTVPVAYCERKYVRKPKGVEPGTVVMEREKIVFVEPRLP